MVHRGPPRQGGGIDRRLARVGGEPGEPLVDRGDSAPSGRGRTGSRRGSDRAGRDARGRRRGSWRSRRVAADAVDERRRELDQALVEGALGEIVGAHPGRLEQLVRLEEVAPLVGVERRVEGPSPLRPAGAAGTPWRGRPGGRSGWPTGPPSGELDHVRSASACRPPNPSLELVPPLDVALAEPPAEPDLATAGERREVDQAGLDLARVMPISSIRATPACIRSITPCIRSRRHAHVGRRSWRLASSASPRHPPVRLSSAPPAWEEDLVAEPDQLRALVAQRLEDRPDLRDRRVRLVEIVEPGHRRILARRDSPPARGEPRRHGRGARLRGPSLPRSRPCGSPDA